MKKSDMGGREIKLISKSLTPFRSSAILQRILQDEFGLHEGTLDVLVTSLAG